MHRLNGNPPIHTAMLAARYRLAVIHGELGLVRKKLREHPEVADYRRREADLLREIEIARAEIREGSK